MLSIPIQLRLVATCLAAVLLALACGREGEPRAAGGAPASEPTSPRPSILLVTLDTTRADAIGPDASGIVTSAFNALAARGRRFRQAYATVPETLPSHASMLTGLYPAGHGVHENGRSLGASHQLVAERLRQAGFRTAAFVSSFTLARRFGLARGFETYDDDLPATGLAERRAAETTDAAIAYLEQGGAEPLFLWVHYFDPHHPYEPPEPYRQQFKATPYLGEVAAMDEQLGRLLAAFDERAPGLKAIVVAGDHGEGLGDHGEAQHGNLLYQSTMHVPLVIAGPGVPAGVSETPVSTRRIFHTILDWAGLGADGSLRKGDAEVVLGEAMKPFLEYGWQPQVMTVEGRHKSILAGRLEIYDIASDPGEARDLSGDPVLRSSVPATLRDYPVPSPATAAKPPPLDEDARRALASLGYIGATAAPVIRKDAPRPVEMAPLFDVIEEASGLFVAEEYKAAVPLLERVLEADPYNLDAALRLATSHSALGHEARAVELFRRAAQISPTSPDVPMYLALHYARGKDWERAVPMLERVLAASPDRMPALEALTRLRERQGRLDEAVALRQKIYALRRPTQVELLQLGELAMGAGRTDAAIAAFEAARTQAPDRFRHDFELGLLYLDARRLAEAREALDRVPPSHPEYPMALFKRAQVSVLLNEPDRAARIAAAQRHADATTRPLIARERLFH